MDMDSTAIQIECIDEIAKLAGTGELVSAITESAMRGELDFEQSLRRRVGTLKGAPESILQQVREKLPLMPGLIETIKHYNNMVGKPPLLLVALPIFADYLKSLLNLDFAASNQFEIIDGTLTGNVKVAWSMHNTKRIPCKNSLKNTVFHAKTPLLLVMALMIWR